MSSTVLVIGGTGAMGGRVVRRLLEATDHTVHVFTRNPDAAPPVSERVRLVRGDLNDVTSIEAAMKSADQAFVNTDFFSTGSVMGEYHQGVAVLEAARNAGIDRLVWSSLDSAATLTQGRVPVPHYDSKAAVAAHIALHRSDEMMRKDVDGWYTEHVTILTTAPYFENFQGGLAPQPATLPDGRDGLAFAFPLGTARYPLIGLDDIAWFAVYALQHWQSWGARDLAVAGDTLSGEQIAAAFEAVTGTPAGYVPIPLEVLRSSIPGIGHDLAAMFEFFQARDVVGQDRDLPALRAIHPGLMTFADWVRVSGWRP